MGLNRLISYPILCVQIRVLRYESRRRIPPSVSGARCFILPQLQRQHKRVRRCCCCLVVGGVGEAEVRGVGGGEVRGVG